MGGVDNTKWAGGYYKRLGDHGIVGRKQANPGLVVKGLAVLRGLLVEFHALLGCKVGAGGLLVPLILEMLLGIHEANIKEWALRRIHLCYSVQLLQ